MASKIIQPTADNIHSQLPTLLAGGVREDVSERLITAEMADLAREAAWELDALARALPGLVPRRADNDGAHELTRGICGRFLRLSSVIQSVLDNDPKDQDDMDRLRGMITLQGDGQG
jgi:hypothetical protein